MSDNGRKASVVYEGNGSQTIFLFPFDYLRKAFIYAQDIQNDNVKDLVQGVDFEVDNNRHIHLHTALKAGHVLRLYRKTTTKALVEWQDASVLRSADLTLQEVQLLHLAEETSDKVTDSAGLSVDPMNTNLWNANFKRIGNVLDPVEPQDVVTLNYIQANKDGMINQIKATGQNEIQDITNTSNRVLTNIKDTGNSYIRTQTNLKDTTNTYANTALTYKNQAGNYKDIAQKWAESNGSPDGNTDTESTTGKTKSSKSWALVAKNIYKQAQTAVSQINEKLQQTISILNETKDQQTQVQLDVVDAQTAKNEATTQANKSKAYATEALNSANAAKQSAKDAAKFDPSSYDTREENDKRYVQKITADNTYATKIESDRKYLTKSEKAQSAKEADALTGNMALYNYLYRFDNLSPQLSKSNKELNAMGIFIKNYGIDDHFDNKPTYWGQLINLPAGMWDNESTQFWIDRPDGHLYMRCGNGNINVNNTPFRKILDFEDMYDGNMIKLPNNAKIGVE